MAATYESLPANDHVGLLEAGTEANLISITVTLANAPLRVPVLLDRVRLSAAEAMRLAELGLRAGATVTILRRTAGGGRVIGVGPARIAVGGRMLDRIPVSFVAEPD